MKRLLQKLNEPFPETDSFSDNIRNVIGIGLFVTFFLYFFQSSGMYNYTGNVFFLCAQFGLITIVVALSIDIITEKVLKVKRTSVSWTLKKWILYVLCLILSISVANYAYYCYIADVQSLSWSTFLHMAVQTISVGIFPIVFSGLAVQLRANNKHQQQATLIQQTLSPTTSQPNLVRLVSMNQQQVLKLSIDQIYCMESMQNYVAVHYMKDQQVHKELLRNTLSNISQQVQASSLIRCHRSFIVNTQKVEQVSGNAQGLRIQLQNWTVFEIPVSRKYIPVFKNKLKEIT